ncbi:20639_t:CDS:2, partial [Dentiscutata erythropus]
GRQFTGIWKEIELGEEVSCRVYRGKYIHCNKKFRCAKPIKTRAHIAHECPNFEDYAILTETSIEIESKSTSKKKFRPLFNIFCEVLAEKYKISGGRLKYYVETRWIIFHKYNSSIIRFKKCLEDIRDKFAHKITNNKIITILKSHGFFDDMQYLTEILAPFKSAILEVEESQSNLADCYIALLKIGAAINNLPQKEYHKFRNYSYKETGLKFGIFLTIAFHAGMLWKSLKKTKESYESLITQFWQYKMQKDSNKKPNAYTMPYVLNQDTPLSWWSTCEVNSNELQQLAIWLFTIIPSSVACEYTFSTLNWLF